MAIDLRHFKCFVAVADELHFHRAARRLGVAQPALSRTIQNLESAMGVTLLERSNRRVELTDAGQTFLKGCRQILASTEKIVEDAQRVHQGKIGTLRIGYTDNAMNGSAPSLLKGFQDAKPDITVLLTHSVTSDQLNMLEAGTLDFGFATGSVARPELDHIRIQSERFVGVIYDGHRLAGRRSITLSDLAGEPMVQGVKSQWAHYLSYLAPLYRNAGFEPLIVQEGLTTSDIQRLVACGIGIAVLTETVVETLAPGLTVVPLKDVGAKLDTIVAWKPEQHNTAKAHFVSYLRATLRAQTQV